MSLETVKKCVTTFPQMLLHRADMVRKRTGGVLTLHVPLQVQDAVRKRVTEQQPGDNRKRQQRRQDDSAHSPKKRKDDHGPVQRQSEPPPPPPPPAPKSNESMTE